MGVPPMPHKQLTTNSWAPFKNWIQFELANFLYTCNQMPAQQINMLLDIWAESLCNAGSQPLFLRYKDLFGAIDAILLDDIKWQSFTIKFKGMPDDNLHHLWMENMYDIWFQCPLQTIHNILGNLELKGWMDFRAYHEFEAQLGN